MVRHKSTHKIKTLQWKRCVSAKSIASDTVFLRHTKNEGDNRELVRHFVLETREIRRVFYWVMKRKITIQDVCCWRTWRARLLEPRNSPSYCTRPWSFGERNLSFFSLVYNSTDWCRGICTVYRDGKAGIEWEINRTSDASARTNLMIRSRYRSVYGHASFLRELRADGSSWEGLTGHGEKIWLNSCLLLLIFTQYVVGCSTLFL